MQIQVAPTVYLQYNVGVSCVYEEDDCIANAAR